MSFTDIDATKPDGTEKISTADNYIRELKADIETNLAEISGYPNNSALKKAIWTTATRPTENLVTGLSGYNTTTSTEEYYSNGWKSIGNVPIGGIILWSGSIASLSSYPNWVLCDGTNGTPDLRDKFVVGAGTTYSVGANSIPTHTHSTANHTLTIDEIPPHSHSFSNGIGWGEGEYGDGYGRTDGHNPRTLWNGTVGFSGYGVGHNHGNTGYSSSIPPYYALAYIMRIS